jgi:hypothetical protein
VVVANLATHIRTQLLRSEKEVEQIEKQLREQERTSTNMFAPGPIDGFSVKLTIWGPGGSANATITIVIWGLELERGRLVARLGVRLDVHQAQILRSRNSAWLSYTCLQISERQCGKMGARAGAGVGEGALVAAVRRAWVTDEARTAGIKA